MDSIVTIRAAAAAAATGTLWSASEMRWMVVVRVLIWRKNNVTSRRWHRGQLLMTRSAAFTFVRGKVAGTDIADYYAGLTFSLLTVFVVHVVQVRLWESFASKRQYLSLFLANYTRIWAKFSVPCYLMFQYI